MRTNPYAAVVLTLVALAPIPSFAQAPAPPETASPEPVAPFTGEIEVSEALVDVLVTDRDGNQILGLTPADFKITEDGKPLEITGATFYSNRRFLDAAGAAKLGIDPAAVPDRRVYILLFDDQSKHDSDDPTLLVSRQLRAGRDVAQWLREGLEPGDLVAVASFDSRLRLQQELTADRVAIERAIDRAVKSADEPKEWPSRVGPKNDVASISSNLPKDKALRDATPTLDKALAVLAGAVQPIPGRKNLLLFTSGFGQMTAAGAPEAKRFEPMIEALNAANVAVYAADLLPPGTQHPWASVISDMAIETGGRPFFDLTEYRQPLEHVAATTNGYYLVSFKSPHPAGDTGYRPIQVTIGNPEFKVTARRGYRLSN